MQDGEFGQSVSDQLFEKVYIVCQVMCIIGNPNSNVQQDKLPFNVISNHVVCKDSFPLSESESDKYKSQVNIYSVQKYCSHRKVEAISSSNWRQIHSK